MELKQVGLLIAVFVGIVVAVSFLTGSIFPTIGTMTQTVDVPITTQVTFPSNTTALTLTGQAVSNVVFINGSTTIAAGNYTVTNYVLNNGQLTATVIANGATGYQDQANVNVSYTYEPFGYDTNSGNRAVIGLIAIFAALALAVFALVPALREGVLDYFG